MLDGADILFACGPEGLLETAARTAAARGIPSQLSMERRMACGIGICLGCAIAIRTDGRLTYQKVCKDGPAFAGEEMAQAIETAGADALYTTNTPLGMKIDWRTRQPVLGNGQGPICGPAIRPIGVLRTWELYKRVHLPIIASGGICTWEDALEYILAGASAVGVGSAQFVYPDTASNIVRGLEQYALEQHLTSILDLVGMAQEAPGD